MIASQRIPGLNSPDLGDDVGDDHLNTEKVTEETILQRSDSLAKKRRNPLASAMGSVNEVIEVKMPKLGDEVGDDIIILEMIAKQPEATAKQLSEISGISQRQISRIVKALRESGEITRVGSDRKGYWKIKRSDYI